MNLITRARAIEALNYCPETGAFTWRIQRGQIIHPGDKAGCVNGKGYVIIHVDGREYRAHRLAWLIVHGAFPEHEIDHRNGVRADNRIANLRCATTKENQWNRTSASSRNSTGILGVSRYRDGRWLAKITRDNRATWLGIFDSPELAQQAYAKARADSGMPVVSAGTPAKATA